MKKILYIFLALFFLLSAKTAFATDFTPETMIFTTYPGSTEFVDLVASGVICGDLPLNIIVYKGEYPDYSDSISGYAFNSIECNNPPAGSSFHPKQINTSYGNDTGFYFMTASTTSGLNPVYMQWYWDESSQTVSVDNGITRFTNLEISTTSQNMRLRGFISPSDSDVHVVFNISTPLYSQWDHADFTATTTGFFDMSIPYQNFSTSTIDRFTFTGTLLTPHVCFTDCETSPTSQIYDTISTSTNEAGIGVTDLPTPRQIEIGVGKNCNPTDTINFNVPACVTFLFFPNAQEVAENVGLLKTAVLNRMPLGYFTRLYAILASSATTSIPGFTYTWGNDGGPLDGKSFTFDTDYNLAQAKGLTDEMVSNTSGNHKTAWQILETFINTFLAIFVLYAIIHDVMALDLLHHKR